MAIEFVKQSYSGRFPEIWRGECKVLPGGFTPAQNLPVGTVLRRGTPVCVDFDTRKASICKAATALEGSTTTAVRVAKGLYFVAGDALMKVGKTDAIATVSSVDTSNSGYDTLNLSAAIAGLAAGDAVAEAEGAGTTESPAAIKNLPNAVVAADRHFDGHGIPTIDAAYEAVVLAPSLLFPVLEDWKQGIALKNNPNIIFITQ